MSRWDEALHPRDRAGRFSAGNTPRGRIDAVLARPRIDVTSASRAGNGRPTHQERQRQLAAMSDAEARAALRAVNPHLDDADLAELPRETVDRLTLHREIVLDRVHVPDDDDEDDTGRGTREGDPDQPEREARSAAALDAYLTSDRPAQSGGRTDLPDNVRLVDVDELRDTLRYGVDGFGFHRDEEWNRLLDRQLADRRTPEWIDAIVRDGLQPLQITDGDTLRNGYHRLAIAMLMGIRQVPVSSRDYEEWTRRRTGNHFAVPLR